eukprot:6184078-Pleurochrysis_carterae.AAC.1
MGTMSACWRPHCVCSSPRHGRHMQAVAAHIFSLFDRALQRGGVLRLDGQLQRDSGGTAAEARLQPALHVGFRSSDPSRFATQ